MSYKVTADYVTARTTDRDGKPVVLGFYRGAVLPDDVTQETIDHLLDVSLIVDESAAEHVSALTTDDELEAILDDSDGPGGHPAKSAAKADWVAYAVSQGSDEATADGKTKDELIAEYGA